MNTRDKNIQINKMDRKYYREMGGKGQRFRLFYEELRARRKMGSDLQYRTFSVSEVLGDQSSAYRSDRCTFLKIDSARHLRTRLKEDEQCLQREDTNREIKYSMVKIQ
jgi:hypothetical protein